METVGELLLLTDKDLSKIRNLGPACLSEVKEKLAKYSPPMADIVMKTGNIDETDSTDN
ncbi:MAG TPA: hypothetical protein DEF42_02480 [Desulfosporosinus sp.]|nr:hypothetical protein [Desulfosporosinus sp.]